MNEILLADDEPNQIELMKFNLEKNGFLVKSAYNGEQALDMIYEKKTNCSYSRLDDAKDVWNRVV